MCSKRAKAGRFFAGYDFREFNDFALKYRNFFIANNNLSLYHVITRLIGIDRLIIIVIIINPRRACARGLQYLSCLSVCVCVCVCVFSLFWHLAQSVVQTAVSATSARYGHEI